MTAPHRSAIRRVRGIPVCRWTSKLTSEAVAEADAQLEVLCGVAGGRRVAEEEAAGARGADADYTANHVSRHESINTL
jgi:hypothetical protein